jgi:hypothetical protein
VGRRTRGRVRSPSIHARRPPCTPYINLAASIPRKNVATRLTVVCYGRRESLAGLLFSLPPHGWICWG